MASNYAHSNRPHPPMDSVAEKPDQDATILTDHFNAYETSSATVKNIERGNFIPAQPHLLPPLPPLIPLPNVVTVGTLGPRATPIASTESIFARAKEYGEDSVLPSINVFQKPDRPERFGPRSHISSSREENQDPEPKPDDHPSRPLAISNTFKLSDGSESFGPASFMDNSLDRKKEPGFEDRLILPLQTTNELENPNRPDRFSSSHPIFARKDEPTTSLGPNDMTNLHWKSMELVAIIVGSFCSLMLILIISCICTKRYATRRRAARKARILAADPENREGRPEEHVGCMCGDQKPIITLSNGLRYVPKPREYCRTWEEHSGKRYHGANFAAAMKRCEIKRLMRESGLGNMDVNAGRSEWNIAMGGYSADGTEPTNRASRSMLDDRGKGVEINDLDVSELTRRANDMELQNLDRPGQRIVRERKGRYLTNPVYKIGPMRTARPMHAPASVATSSGLTPAERSLDLASVEKREAEQREAGEWRRSIGSTATSTTTLESILEESIHKSSVSTLASLPEESAAAEKETTGENNGESLSSEIDSRQTIIEPSLKSTD